MSRSASDDRILRPLLLPFPQGVLIGVDRVGLPTHAAASKAQSGTITPAKSLDKAQHYG
jgi:hypothetical protein